MFCVCSTERATNFTSLCNPVLYKDKYICLITTTYWLPVNKNTRLD